MATALAKGFLQAGLVRAQDILAGDPAEGALQHFAEQTGGRTTRANRDVLDASQVVILAVKPDMVQQVLSDLKNHFTPKHLLVSIAAGVKLEALQKPLRQNMRVIRVMPNTPALVGESASAFAVGPSARDEDAALAHKLFSSVGVAFQMKESLLDAVTGLSGSGPAYAYLMMEALSDGGVAAGLPREVATRLAAQTLLGAAKMVLETGMHPGVLKDMVASPGGTTIEGVHELEKGAFRSTVMNAVRAAAAKATELGSRS